MKIIDLKDAPGFNPAVKNGTDSVSTGKVFMATTHSYKPSPTCHIHGAMNKVSEAGIWRCLACNEGCWEVKEK